MEPQPASQTFCSYSRLDAAFALKLASDLLKVDENVWLDQLELVGGTRWDVEVEKALKRCDSIIVILSPESVASDNVLDEISFGLEEGKTIIPVIKTKCPLPFRIRRLQNIDFSGEYDEAFKKLVKALQQKNTSKKHASKNDTPVLLKDSKIFINYRRNDNMLAKTLQLELLKRYNKEMILLDYVDPPPGVDFVEAIDTAIASCSIMVVVIGEKWAGAMMQLKGKDYLSDFAALEIATALSKNIFIIPVRFNDAMFPNESELPETIKKITRRQLVDISLHRFETDIAHLVKVIDEKLGITR